jgi:hypothetical protein
MGQYRNACNILVRKPEEKRPLERPRHGWKDIIKMYLKEIRCENVHQIQLGQIVISFDEPLGSTKDREFLDQVIDCQLVKVSALWKWLDMGYGI